MKATCWWLKLPLALAVRFGTRRDLRSRLGWSCRLRAARTTAKSAETRHVRLRLQGQHYFARDLQRILPANDDKQIRPGMKLITWLLVGRPVVLLELDQGIENDSFNLFNAGARVFLVLKQSVKIEDFDVASGLCLPSPAPTSSR